MAKKKKFSTRHLQTSPLMLLSFMAFFLMMPIMLSMMNTTGNKKPETSRAAERQVLPTTTPTPEAEESSQMQDSVDMMEVEGTERL